MDIFNTNIDGAFRISPRVYKDDRGVFYESFHKKRYHFIKDSFVQDNFSISKKNALRGLHFSHQKKLVGVLYGKVFDVIVDIRPSSLTYKQWEGFILDDEKFEQLYIPQGCAHGFCVLSEKAHLIYKVSDYYDPKREREFRWNDPTIDIHWPIANPILSKRDQTSPFFEDLELECISGL